MELTRQDIEDPQAERIDYYWADAFRLPIQEFLQPGVRVMQEREPRPQPYVRVFADGVRCIISTYAELEDELRRRAAALSAADCLWDQTMAELFDGLCDAVPQRGFQSFLEAGGLKPFRLPEVRRLGGPDRTALAQFLSECPPDDVSHSSLSCLRQYVYGYVEGDRVLAAAYFTLWTPYAVGIGPLVHPARRGRGLGKAVASAATEAALDCGFLVVWPASIDNTASVATAKSLGFREYGQSYQAAYPDEVRSKHSAGEQWDGPYRVDPRLHTVGHS